MKFGLLTGKFHREPNLLQSRPLTRRKILAKSIESSRPVVDILESIAEARGMTAAQVALNWLVNFSGDTVVAIPGASKPSHAEESAGAMGFALTAEEMDRIDEVSRRFR